MKEKIKKILVALFLLVICVPITAKAFVTSDEFSYYDSPGFFSGIWHGLLAPYFLIARWFIDDVTMYAVPNSGWFYDFGFLIGIAGSLPIGWLFAIISFVGHLIT